ncbi:DUF2251 domain-containing protein [Flavobacterium sp. LT1R49]|uniref:DUF2251 domain-containing protein n=1 Tax=Flavobacterium arabinosi TaxID=3398737 RepID=UPI003A8AB75B
MILDVEETLIIGEETFIESFSIQNSFAVAFEDDLRTGYFYALENQKEIIILDALHIYDVENISDKNKPSIIQIAWNNEGDIAAFLINDYCHAIFDFKNKAGYCRNGFPDSKGWAIDFNRNLTDDLITKLLG